MQNWRKWKFTTRAAQTRSSTTSENTILVSEIISPPRSLFSNDQIDLLHYRRFFSFAAFIWIFFIAQAGFLLSAKLLFIQRLIKKWNFATRFKTKVLNFPRKNIKKPIDSSCFKIIVQTRKSGDANKCFQLSALSSLSAKKGRTRT